MASPGGNLGRCCRSCLQTRKTRCASPTTPHAFRRVGRRTTLAPAVRAPPAAGYRRHGGSFNLTRPSAVHAVGAWPEAACPGCRNSGVQPQRRIKEIYSQNPARTRSSCRGLVTWPAPPLPSPKRLPRLASYRCLERVAICGVGETYISAMRRAHRARSEALFSAHRFFQGSRKADAT